MEVEAKCLRYLLCACSLLTKGYRAIFVVPGALSGWSLESFGSRGGATQDKLDMYLRLLFNVHVLVDCRLYLSLKLACGITIDA